MREQKDAKEVSLNPPPTVSVLSKRRDYRKDQGVDRFACAVARELFQVKAARSEAGFFGSVCLHYGKSLFAPTSHLHTHTHPEMHETPQFSDPSRTLAPSSVLGGGGGGFRFGDGDLLSILRFFSPEEGQTGGGCEGAVHSFLLLHQRNE